MIHALYALKREYLFKKIYIWNINIDSLGLFMRIKFGGIDVQGFVTIQDEYVGKTYLNHPVVSLKQVETIEDSLILVADDVSQCTKELLPVQKAFAWKAVSGINEDLRKSKIIVYGIGNGAKQLHAYLDKEGIKEQMYCLTNKSDFSQFIDKPIIEAAELKNYTDHSVVISVSDRQYRNEILGVLDGFTGQIYMDLEYMIASTVGGVASPLQNLNSAMETHKKIYLYGRKSFMTEFLENFLEGCGIRISGYVYDVEDKTKHIKSLCDFIVEGIHDKFLLIHEETYLDLIKARESIETVGFSIEKKNCTCFQWNTRSKERISGQVKEYPDPLLGKSIKYACGGSGWKRYGEEQQNKIRILILGNSTSSEEFYIENWISKLYSKLKQLGIKSVIYNGAHSTNDVSAELLRFLRDGNVLRPHIVISMSGANNLYYKECANQFNSERAIEWVKSVSADNEYCSGVYSTESLYQFWLRNEKILKLISESYGAHFFCFLQPMNMTLENMSLQEKSLYEQERRIVGAEEFKQLANNEEGYINLMHLFDHQEDMYIDFCHHSDKGHTVITDMVIKEIMPVLLTLKEKANKNDGDRGI